MAHEGGRLESDDCLYPSERVTGFRAEIHDFTKSRILEVARDLFFEKGYEGTTLSDISRSLDVTKSFIYTYFRAKSEILCAVCEMGISRPLDVFEQARTVEITAAAKLRRIVEDLIGIIIENQTYIVVYDREAKNLDRPAARRLMSLRQEFDRRLTMLLEEGAMSGEFYVENLELTAIAISGTCKWVSNWFRPGRHSQQEVTLHTVRLVDRMVVRGASGSL